MRMKPTRHMLNRARLVRKPRTSFLLIGESSLRIEIPLQGKGNRYSIIAWKRRGVNPFLPLFPAPFSAVSGKDGSCRKVGGVQMRKNVLYFRKSDPIFALFLFVLRELLPSLITKITHWRAGEHSCAVPANQGRGHGSRPCSVAPVSVCKEKENL